MKWFHAIGLFIPLTNVSSFAPTPVRHVDSTTVMMIRDGNHRSRRHVLIQSVLVGVSTFLPLSPAHAAKKESEPLTKENVQAAFGDLIFELEDPNGGVAVMQKRIDEQDWEGLMEFTKTYDGFIRKLKWGRAKAFLTNNAEKEVATLQGNAITFDLIGINRSCRAGQENAELANKYLNELRTDLQKMIDMQGKIQYNQDGFDAYMNAVKGN
jgi:hypothetical protein